jgi:transcriptional regulator with XRE-family HTH domain
MDDARVGLAVRALRRRRGWRQADLAHQAKVSQSLVSLVERGHLDRVSLRVLRRLLAAVEARVSPEVRWRGGDLDRLLDEGHSALADAMVRRLRELAWLVEVEVSYSEYGERGSIDLLAFEAASRSLLVVELKTTINAAEATIRKLDEKGRLATRVAGARFGWIPASVSRLLVIQAGSTNRRRIARHASVFDAALPAGNIEVSRWLRAPSERLRGRLFVSATTPRGGRRSRGGRDRIRVPRPGPDEPLERSD